MKKKNKYIFWVSGVIALGIIGFIVYKIRSKSKKKDGKAIVIGDSQTQFIDNGSEKVTMLGKEEGEKNLWHGGKNLTWLLNAVKKYPVTKDVSYVVINIGTNGNFSPKDNVEGLVSELKRVFPNADLLAVKGSWNWSPNNRDVTEKDVNTYYDRFKKLGVKIMPTPIGPIEPHGNKPVYKQIGKELDNIIS